MLDRAGILARIPHQGSMCLLAQVTAYDEHRVHCLADSHHDADNPLRAHGRLAAACGIEYAAQAMAVHGALLAPPAAAPQAGYLASVRGVDFHVARLDDIADPLEIVAERLSGSDNSILYQFTVSAAGRPLLSGRASVILDAALPA